MFTNAILSYFIVNISKKKNIVHSASTTVFVQITKTEKGKNTNVSEPDVFQISHAKYIVNAL